MNSSAPARRAALRTVSIDASGSAKAMFSATRVGEQEGVLEDDADGAAQVAQAQLPDVDAVETDAAGVDVVEAGQQARHRGLAARRRADERDRLAGRA